MAQRVEDIDGLVKLINDEKNEILNKVNELNQNTEINKILNVSLPELEELINSKHSTALAQFSALNSALESVLAKQDTLSKSAETEEFFSSLKTDVNNFYNELLNQHNFLETVRHRLNEIADDKTDRDEVINNVVSIKGDVENFNRSLEAYIIDINSNLQEILKNILTMDTTEQNDIIKRELENIFLSSNAILSSLEISDKKDDELFNVISSVENKIDELIEREPVNAVKAIQDLQSEIGTRFDKTSTEITQISDNFKSVSASNLQQILSDIGNSSRKIDELNLVIHEDFAQNLAAIKNIVENISIDRPTITPENPVLSNRLDEILKAVSDIEIPAPASNEYDIEQNINTLKTSLNSISEILNTINLSDNGAAAEKLVSLEVTISESIRHYEDNIIALTNRFNEYLSAVAKMNELTETKLDDSITGIAEVKLEIKGLIESLEGFNSKADVRFETSLENFKTVDEAIREKLNDITNALRISGDSVVNKFEQINGAISANIDAVNEKLDNLSTAVDTGITNVDEAIKGNSSGINEKLDSISANLDEKFNTITENFNRAAYGVNNSVETNNNTVQEKITLLGENISERNDRVNEKLDNLNTSLDEKLNTISTSIDEKYNTVTETLNQTTGGINTTLETTVNTVQEKFDLLGENISERNDRVNEKLDNLNTSLDEKLNTISTSIDEKYNTVTETLNQTTGGINTTLETTVNTVQEKFDLLSENISERNDRVNEKLDNLNTAVDEKFNTINGSLEQNAAGIISAVTNTENNLANSINLLNSSVSNNHTDLSQKLDAAQISVQENLSGLSETITNSSQNADTKLDSIHNTLREQLQSVDEAISINTANLNSVNENVNNSIQNGINILNDELKTNTAAFNEKFDDVTSVINSKLTSVNDALNLNTETFNTKVDSLSGELLGQIQNANESLAINTSNISASVENLNITMKENIENINSMISTGTISLNEKVENIDGSVREQLAAVNAALADNIEHINSILGDVNSTVESKLVEIGSDVKINVGSIKECFDSALSALDMVRTDILDNLTENNDSLTELVNNTIKEIKEINTGADDDMQDKFTNLREHILAVILELQARQEELLSIAKRSDERNLQALDDITSAIRNVEQNLQINTAEYKQIFEEKMTDLKADMNILQQMLSVEGENSNEKIFNKLFTVEALINEVSDKYEEKLTTLSGSITSYINNVEKNNEDAEIKLGNSVSEITGIRNDLQKIAEELSAVESNQDVKFYELTENFNNKINELISNISGIKNIVQTGDKGEVKQNLSEIDLKFEQLFNSLNKVREYTPEDIDQSIIELEEKLGAVKQEINLVNTDIIDVIDTKTAAIIDNFAPVREAVAQILDFDFNKIITEVKTQVELSYLNLTSDLNSSLTMSQESVSKLETVFSNVAKKIIAIDNQMTDFSRNNLEILNLTIENINKVVEKNLDETTTLSLQWKNGLESIEEKLASVNEQYEISLRNCMATLKEDLQKNIDANFENIKSFVSVVANEEDALHSIDILKTELTNRMEILTNSFREELAKSNGNSVNMQQFSTDLKSYIDKILVNFAKHIETTVNGSELTAQQVDEILSKWAGNLNSDIIKEFDAIADKLSDIQTTINLNDTSDISKNIQETLDALHEKVDVLAMSDDSSDDIIYEIEDIKNILTKVSGKSEEFSELLKEINKIEENSSKNANDIKESVMSAIIAVFDQISFVEESEDIKDFVEEKTDEINQNLIEVRNQLKQIGVGDSEEYSYTLQDVESDIAKLRMVLNEMSQSSSSDDVLEILDNIHKISGSIDGLQASLTTDQIYDLKNDVERLNEDIVSISTRTNKLLLTSDESYKALNNGLDEFSKVILKLEERINILDNTKNSERIEKKLDNVNSMVSVIANSGKVMNQVMMYLGEWIDTTSENISAISEKTSEIDEIKEIITDLRDTIPSKSAILNELENRFEEQQQRLDRLEMKFDRVLALLEDREDARLNKKFERMEKQMTKLSINIEKLASYVDE